MKKILSVVLTVFVILIFTSNSVKAEDVSSDVGVTELDRIYQNEYEKSIKEVYRNINDDTSAYSFILHNPNCFFLRDGKIKITNDIDIIELNDVDKSYLIDFVNRVNALSILDAIKIMDDYSIKVQVPNSNKENGLYRIGTYDLLTLCRSHASELRSVYDNAVFSQRTLTAGLYFAEREKTGGIWDLKSILGKNNNFFVSEIDNNMTGEEIGNFHYGYVGKSVFSRTTLLSAAGMYQVISGTSSWGYFNSYFDDPADQSQINLGINWYIAEH